MKRITDGNYPNPKRSNINNELIKESKNFLISCLSALIREYKVEHFSFSYHSKITSEAIIKIRFRKPIIVKTLYDIEIKTIRNE